MAIYRAKLKEGQEYIELGNLIKHVGLISTGGAIKEFLLVNEVKVNGIAENRRGRKIRSGDTVEIEEDQIIVD